MNALAMAIGSNIGTTITAVIGSAGSNAAGKRLAAAHVIFNLTTGLAAILLINQFAWLVDKISVYVGIKYDNYTLKLAMFHSLFNVFGVLLTLPLISKIEKIICRMIKDDSAEDITMPKYLNKSTIKYIETAVPALIKESRHLFDNAFEIIAHGLNIHRSDILSNKKLKELIPESIENMRINIDELYIRKIKTVYSKIIKYSTIIQSYKLSEEEAHLVNQIRVANRYVIEFIKHIGNLQRNMAIYIVSPNDEIRNEYNYLRLKIAKVMREIYRTESCEDINIQYEKLLALQQKAKMHDVLVNGKLDKLIRDRLLTSKMATSLMNDSALVARICERLITVAELLYINADTILEREEDIREVDSDGDFLEENTQ
jgi:phosphate:Na+ symporter